MTSWRKNAAPQDRLLKKSVERIVDQYDFPQLERDEIMYTIADVLTNRLLPEKDIK